MGLVVSYYSASAEELSIIEEEGKGRNGLSLSEVRFRGGGERRRESSPFPPPSPAADQYHEITIADVLSHIS